MILKEICQICGDTRVIDINQPVKLSRTTHWKTYHLGDFGVGKPYDNYEVNICGGCLDTIPSESESYLISNTEKAHEVHYDWDSMTLTFLDAIKFLVGGKE